MLSLFLTIEFVQLVAIAAAGLSGFVEKPIWSPAYSYHTTPQKLDRLAGLVK
jgi:hypothetical protein